MKFIFALVGGALILTGCSSFPPVKERNDEQLCRHATIGWLVGMSSASRAELTARGLIEPGEWELIVDGQVKVGMTECAILGSTYNYGSPYVAVGGSYRFGADKTVILKDYDPSAPMASYVNSNQGFNRLFLSPRPEPVVQAYVPKYLVTIKKGKVVDCHSVALYQYGRTEDNAKLFPLPCMKDVPGFEK